MCVYFEYSWISWIAVHTFFMSHLCVYMHTYYVCVNACTDLGVCGGDVLI